MALETLLTVVLIIVGMGVIVIGVLLLQARQAPVQKEVIVQEPPTWSWAGGWLPTWSWPNGAPYYSHVPLRPIVY